MGYHNPFENLDALSGFSSGNSLSLYQYPPELQVARQRAGADHAQFVAFGQVFNGDDGFHY